MYRGVATSSQIPSSNLRLSLLLTAFAASPPHPSPRRLTSHVPQPLPSSPFLSPSPLKLSAARGFLPNTSFHRWTSARPSGRGLDQHRWNFRERVSISCVSMLRLKHAQVAFSSGTSGEEDKEILVQHLLVGKDDLKLLVELLKRHSQGEDLSDLAANFSLCPSKENGGMLGWVRRGQLVPEFEEAAFSAPLNKVVRCKTEHGWHLLQVLSERVIQDVRPENFHLKMQDPSFFNEAQLIDVREPDEVEQASLPGFKALPLRQFGTWGPEITKEFDPQKDTYVLCHHGVRSLQVARWLQTQGFKRVFNIAGGIHAYALKADSSVPTY